jgi:hypothetical protein
MHAAGPAERRAHSGDQGRGADAASFAEPGHDLAELPGLTEIGHDHPVSLVRFSFLILIGRFATLEV